MTKFIELIGEQMKERDREVKYAAFFGGLCVLSLIAAILTYIVRKAE